MPKNAIHVIRSIGAVVVGYLILALTNMAYVIMWYVNPVAELYGASRRAAKAGPNQEVM